MHTPKSIIIPYNVLDVTRPLGGNAVFVLSVHQWKVLQRIKDIDFFSTVGRHAKRYNLKLYVFMKQITNLFRTSCKMDLYQNAFQLCPN